MAWPWIHQITGAASCCPCKLRFSHVTFGDISSKQSKRCSSLLCKCVFRVPENTETKCREHFIPRHVSLCCKLLVTPRRCNDFVHARHIDKAAVLRTEVHTVRSSWASESELLQKRHHEEENFHASEGLSNTSSFSWKWTKKPLN